ncbi:MAG: DNA helicase UvrD [Candidatus Hydrothermota bacterium]|nr:MAG: DNA helicase UvrD [Candidatus Hydrothermae bacterium]
MKYYIADLHIHSHYSRATSQDMNVDGIARYAKLKGVSLVGTGDILHPLWRKELQEKLTPKLKGIYTYGGVDFILSGETSHIYSQDGRNRRIHIVLLFPDFETAEKIANKLAPYGDLLVDGRPTFGLSVKHLVEVVRSVSEDVMIIPAHIWTPWYSLFGANSGFDSVFEAFGRYANELIAMETGLSSDPPMNWRVSELDRYVLVSNSDAHSPSRIGREANVFSEPMDYFELKRVLYEKDRSKFLFTIEFFPEEGKYHYDGHRNCGIRLSPKETLKYNGICPVCGKPLTVGVLHRVEKLADREEGFVPQDAIPYKHLVSLDEIIADAFKVGKTSKKVMNEYHRLIGQLGSELEILLETDFEAIERVAGHKIAQGVKRVREGKVKVIPGYDGVYGEIHIFDESEAEEPSKQEPQKQMSLF